MGQVRALHNFYPLVEPVTGSMLEILSEAGADPGLSYRDVDGQHYTMLKMTMFAMVGGSVDQDILRRFPTMASCFNEDCFHILQKWVGDEFYEVVRDILEALDRNLLSTSLGTKVDELAGTVKHHFQDQEPTLESSSIPQSETTVSLSQALKLDAVDLLEKLLKASPESIENAIIDGGTTALHLAAQSGSLGAAKLLIASGAKTETQDDNGQTAAHRCAYDPNTDVLQLLLHEGADVEKADSKGRTVWHLAAAENNVAVLQFLLHQCHTVHTSLTKTDIRGGTPLFSAVETGSEESLLLLSHHTSSFDGRTEDGLAFAHFASRLSLSTLKYFVNKGLDITVKAYDGTSLLHYFAKMAPLQDPPDLQRQTREKIDYLLEMGLSADAVADNGQTALHVLLSRKSWRQNANLEVRAQFDDALHPPLPPSGRTPVSYMPPPPPPPIVSSAMYNSGILPLSSLVEALAANHAINIKDCNGTTAMELFCSHRNLFEKKPLILRKLVECGADIMIKDSLGRSPLQILFEAHRKDVDTSLDTSLDLPIFVELLLLILECSQDFDELSKTSLGPRILHWAVKQGRQVLAGKLLKHSVDPTWRLAEEDYMSPLDRACKNGSTKELLEMLLNECDAEKLNWAHPKTGYNLLHTLCSGYSMVGGPELMKLLIEKGVEIDARDQIGWTRFQVAALRGKANLMCFLIQAGADPHAQDRFGASVAHMAACSGSKAALQVLDDIGTLERDSDISSTWLIFNNRDQEREFKGCKFWHVAGVSGFSAAALEYLFERTIFTDADCRTGSGETALHIAAYCAPVKALRYLLSKGADPRSSNNTGETPLHLAAQSGEVANIYVLVAAGAKLDAATSAGMLPLHYASKHRHDLAVDTLLKLRSPYVPDHESQIPYLHARIVFHDTTARILEKHEFGNTSESFSSLDNTQLMSVKEAIRPPKKRSEIHLELRLSVGTRNFVDSSSNMVSDPGLFTKAAIPALQSVSHSKEALWNS